ncbi:MAG: ATP synthase F1 subunit epsilon [Endomicrobium sp.]|jgi:F-type H+-transporting ATPase subunit epsilon|nr:ATP synthase F1 subunit epsilon [Endomicrobium sp.]
MNSFVLEILSPDGSAFKGNVYSVSLPTSAGIITVLPGHTNLVTKLKHGEIIIDPSNSGGVKKIAVTGGFVEIYANTVNIVAEFAINSDETNKNKIAEAVKLAKEMKLRKKDAVDSAVIESQLKKAVFELKSNASIKRKKR